MRGARHSALSVAAAMVAVALLAILSSGCGSSSTESSGEETSAKTATPPGAVVPVCTAATANVGAMRVSGVSCATGRKVAAGWSSKSACSTPSGASRTSCKVGAYRCLGITTERGLVVSCARPRRSISFIAKRK